MVNLEKSGEEMPAEGKLGIGFYILAIIGGIILLATWSLPAVLIQNQQERRICDLLAELERSVKSSAPYYKNPSYIVNARYIAGNAGDPETEAQLKELEESHKQLGKSYDALLGSVSDMHKSRCG